MPTHTTLNAGTADSARSFGKGLLALLFFAAGANAGLVAIKPILVGALMDGFRFSASQAGFVVTIEMVGMGLGTSLVALSSPASRRRIAVVGAALFFAFSLAPLALHSFGWLLTERLIAGFGSGLVAAVMLGVFASTQNPDRVFGLFFVCVHVLGAVFVPFAGVLVQSSGPAGGYGLLAGLALITLLGASRVPLSSGVNETSAARVLLAPAAITMLAGVLLYWTGTGAVWAFVERVGVSHGLSRTTVSSILGAGQLASLCGALAASALGLRIGRLVPVSGALVLSVVSAGFMGYSTTPLEFGAATLTFNFLCLVFHTFICGAMALHDPSGRVVILGNICLTVGIGLGPAIGGLMASSGSFNSVLWLSIASHLLALLILTPLLARTTRHATGVRSLGR